MCGGATPHHFFDKPSVKIKMVGKMVIIFNNYTLDGKITVIIISFAKDTLVGSKTEIIFTIFNKNTLVGKMEIIIVRFDTVSLVGKIAIISNAILYFLYLDNIADSWSKLKTQKAKILFRRNLLISACLCVV